VSAPRIGRPPVPKKLAKATLLSVRFTESERAEIERAAKRDGVGLSEWARRTLLDAVAKKT
jgi:predicted HicB family RNase H-like nuclease